MPNAQMSEKSQAFADTLVSYAKICMDDEFKVSRCIPTDVAERSKVSPIELSARQEKIKGFMGVSLASDKISGLTKFSRARLMSGF